MRRAARLALAVALAALAGAGCAILPGTARPVSLEELRAEEGWILLDAVPEVRQASERGCGAACLAMVLAHWGAPAGAAALEAECALPGVEGIRAAALRDAARRRGLAAFVVEGTLADLEYELARGRPVVVGLYRPAPGGATAHFQVVVGLHPVRRRMAALDPAHGLVSDSLEGFEAEWRATRGVALVVFRPEAPTAKADPLPTGGTP